MPCPPRPTSRAVPSLPLRTHHLRRRQPRASSVNRNHDRKFHETEGVCHDLNAHDTVDADWCWGTGGRYAGYAGYALLAGSRTQEAHRGSCFRRFAGHTFLPGFPRGGFHALDTGNANSGVHALDRLDSEYSLHARYGRTQLRYSVADRQHAGHPRLGLHARLPVNGGRSGWRRIAVRNRYEPRSLNAGNAGDAFNNPRNTGDSVYSVHLPGDPRHHRHAHDHPGFDGDPGHHRHAH
ncbi:MAG: hypothetical protein ABSE47_13270, partial [Acidimicrobiales bacterium]